MTVEMPRIRQAPSPNYSPTPIAHDLVVVHTMEGGYAGSVAWLCDARAAASAHLCMSEDGSEVSQLVPLGMKAWAQCAFNARGVSIEMPGFTAQGVPDDRLRALAKIAAWLLRAYGIPCQWAQGGQGRGFCSHHDLGEAGGGHMDICGVGDATWRKFQGFVQEAHAAFGDYPLPPFALHGLPNPHQVELPPLATPEPSHGGAPRREAGDVHAHPTPSGFPLGSIGDWQWRLRKIGANPALAVDDDEGRATRAAIGTFQRACGLPVTQCANAATWAKLYAATGSSSAAF
jgi:peptidoglycan hydrolase-like protein with peptidoglycan-binding domain